MAACAFHSKDKKRCPTNCIFRDVFPKSDENALKVRDFFKLEKLVDFAKSLSGIEREEDLVRSPEINAFLWEVYNFVQDINTHSGGPYSRIEAVLKNLKAARSYLSQKPILADVLLEASIKILEKQEEVYDCLALVEGLNLELDKEAEEQAKEAAEQEVAFKEAAA
ncbi:hypothetical protein SLEP1_g45041 [Rubroshorea leprosula]|uniref:LOB domain-containing protein n=1 Tax=Rubroshorea leprosula TaxID=152421 RepID=A0AAV5LIJ8_9ROSI|nr:hypothetical protein SLEP1_g45041 [Rubroshorea leprosula]